MKNTPMKQKLKTVYQGETVMRAMKYKDIEDVNNLLQNSFEEEYSSMNIDTARRLKYMKRGYILEKIVSLLFKEYNKVLDFYVYEEDGNVKGCLRVLRRSKDNFYFATIAIDKSQRRKGIGYNLQTYCEQVCRRRGGKYVTGVVKEENLPSLNLAKKGDFTIYDENYMYILEQGVSYEDKDVEGYRKLKEKDYKKVVELEKKITNETILKIEGTTDHSFLDRLANILREILFGEKFYEYVLEKGVKITAYSKVSHFLDGSSSLVLLSCEKDWSMLKDFVEKILGYHASEKMRTIISKDQTAEKNVLAELGFKEYSHLYAVCKDLRGPHGQE